MSYHVYTVLEILKLSTDYLQQKHIDSARRQAEELLSEALGLGRMELYLDYNRPLTEDELVKCRAWLKRRGQGEPLQYIVGAVNFFDCRFKVTTDVLIPRQETEILVDKIAKALADDSLDGKVLWDICCGSGCIGISLKKKFPALRVILSDLSEKALAIAKENAAKNAVDVEFLHGNLLEPFHNHRANFIVCNPPYVSEDEYKNLDIEVKGYEPKSALVSGSSGLEYYQQFAQILPDYLTEEAKVWFEIGSGQGEAVKNIFNSPYWTRCSSELDWSGRDRFFFLERCNSS